MSFCVLLSPQPSALSPYCEPLALSPQPCVRLERLSDAEVDAPVPLFRLAVHHETRDRIQLVAEVEADRSDRRLVPQPRTDGVAEVVEVNRPSLLPHVAAVEEQYAAHIAGQIRAELRAEREQRIAA